MNNRFHSSHRKQPSTITKKRRLDWVISATSTTNPNDPNDGLGDLNDIFNDDPFSSAAVMSPTGDGTRGEVGLSQLGSPGQGSGANRSKSWQCKLGKGQ